VNYEWISCSEQKKKKFCQVLPRVVAFKEKLPMPLLLPQPILNNECTWLTATAYHFEDLELLKLFRLFLTPKILFL